MALRVPPRTVAPLLLSSVVDRVSIVPVMVRLLRDRPALGPAPRVAPRRPAPVAPPVGPPVDAERAVRVAARAPGATWISSVRMS